MKKIVFLLISGAALCSLWAALRSESTTPQPNAVQGIPDVVVTMIRSKDRLLTELAAERYSAISSRKEVWILTVHDGRRIRKYSDRKVTLLSLPALEPSDRLTMQGYATAYNCGNLQAADLKAKAGKYAEARNICELLLRFGCFGNDDIWRPGIEKRMICLRKLIDGVDVEENRKKLAEVAVEYAALLDLADIENTPPLIVTNLLDVTNW